MRAEQLKVFKKDKQTTMLNFGSVTRLAKRNRVEDVEQIPPTEADEDMDEGFESDSLSRKDERDARNAKLFGKDALQVGLKKMCITQDDAAVNLFKAAYFIGINNLSFALFPSLLDLMRDTGVRSMTCLYNDDKSCAEIIYCISRAIMNHALEKVRKKPFFWGYDRRVYRHFCSSPYGDLFFLFGTSLYPLYHILWNDGCATMVGRKKGVATLLKKVNPRLTAIHCVAHRTNLATSDTSKKIPYARQIDTLVNGIANYFSSSSNRMENLQDLQEELDCDVVKMQRIFEIRWLSRHACLAKVCKSMDALLVALYKDRIDLYSMLCTFECMYAIHFLADILEKMSELSKRFQKDHVDVTTVHGIVQSTILCIKDEYLEERTLDLNASQRGVGNYPIIPEYGPEKGHLHDLRCSLRGHVFFSQKVMRDADGSDMMHALDFQFSYARRLACTTSYAWKTIVAFYGVEITVNNTKYPPLINGDAFKDEFRKFKRQAGIDFAKMSLIEVASLLANNDTWKDMYPNVLKVAQVALVQCCSIAICERGFSARTKIKTKWRNRMETEILDALMRIAIEGQADMDFSSAIEMWKNLAKRHLFAPEGLSKVDA
ncbi:hypothetical protein GOP47_0013862 [Adiantum capillus-veneris]|uniref:HAT C-terminal dimerisation domain-containing protein n=1 Tax=Adiantum capillus-veneris TaxID=13818 RepID=A0A9D4UQ14_ADICA|nr:hypothetical protein GOP47_0013862 [Adiantum capillus-veneris]